MSTAIQQLDRIHILYTHKAIKDFQSEVNKELAELCRLENFSHIVSITNACYPTGGGVPGMCVTIHYRVEDLVTPTEGTTEEQVLVEEIVSEEVKTEEASDETQTIEKPQTVKKIEPDSKQVNFNKTMSSIFPGPAGTVVWDPSRKS